MVSKNMSFSDELFALIEKQRDPITKEQFSACVRRLLLEAIRTNEAKKNE